MSDEKAVSERAYHIWEAEGRPHGRDREHWERASREVEAEAKKRPRKPAATTGAKPAGKVKSVPK